MSESLRLGDAHGPNTPHLPLSDNTSQICAKNQDLWSHQAAFQSKGGPWLNRSTSRPPRPAAPAHHGGLQAFTGTAQVLHNMGPRLPRSPRQHQPHPLGLNAILSLNQQFLCKRSGCAGATTLRKSNIWFKAVNGSTSCSCCANDSERYGNQSLHPFKVKKWSKRALSG